MMAASKGEVTEDDDGYSMRIEGVRARMKEKEMMLMMIAYNCRL